MALSTLTSCGIVNRLNYTVNESTDSIEANRQAVEASTNAIQHNKMLIRQSTRTLEENRRQMEKLSKS